MIVGVRLLAVAAGAVAGALVTLLGLVIWFIRTMLREWA